MALRTRGPNPLAALILMSPADTALDQRIRTVLGRRGLTSGPVRIGSDRRELWPLRSDARECSALDGAVELVGTRWLGPGQGTVGSLVPLDASWPRATLLDVRYSDLPGLTSTEAIALFAELASLAPREEYAPPPARHYAPTAADLDLAELRRNPEALRKRLFELTGNPAVQQALLREVREMPAGG